VAGCCEYADEPSGSGATELVACKLKNTLSARKINFYTLLETEVCSTASNLEKNIKAAFPRGAYRFHNHCWYRREFCGPR
jgi:hypothetical protein